MRFFITLLICIFFALLGQIVFKDNPNVNWICGAVAGAIGGALNWDY
jgi:uncharacterized transporter YbjL